MIDSNCMFGKNKWFISCLFNLFWYDMIYLWIHMKCLMKCMSYLWNNFLIEFNLFMQVNSMKELETNFWDFVHKSFEKIIIWYLWYKTDIYFLFHYILYILMVSYPQNGLRHLSFMPLPFIRKLVLRSDCLDSLENYHMKCL